MTLGPINSLGGVDTGACLSGLPSPLRSREQLVGTEWRVTRLRLYDAASVSALPKMAAAMRLGRGEER